MQFFFLQLLQFSLIFTGIVFPQGTLIWPFQILVMPAIVFFLAEAHLAGFRKILCAAAALTPYQVLFAPFLLLHSIVLGCPLPREEKSSSNISVYRQYKQSIKQSGAVEACWAHNPEVDGSKPFSATNFFFTPLY